MCEPEQRVDHGHGEMPVQRTQPDRATRATTARATEWSSDGVLDPGDTHDKGEISLCVGEAA